MNIYKYLVAHLWPTSLSVLLPTSLSVSLGIRPVWSESLLSEGRKLGSLVTHWAHSEDSDQTGRMPRLIWVFVVRTDHFVGFVTRRLKCAYQTTRMHRVFVVIFVCLWQVFSCVAKINLIMILFSGTCREGAEYSTQKYQLVYEYFIINQWRNCIT